MRFLPRLVLLSCLGLVPLLAPSTALAAGEPGTPVATGTSVLGVAAEANGKVIAVGSAGSAMLVQRLSATGALESRFTAGSGVGRAVAIQPDGKIVVAGTDSGLVVRRFNADGSLDTGFAGGGTARPPGTAANAVAIGPGGTIVAAGSIAATDGFPRVALTRLLSNGAPDTSFANNGSTVIDLGTGSEARGVAIQSDGKIVFAGQQVPGLQVPNALISRVNVNGTLDTSFNGSGTFFYFHPQGGANSTFNAVTIDAAGRILGAGSDLQNAGSRALFVRLSASGSTDASFGTSGILTPPASVNYSGGEPVGARAIAVAPTGDILAAGAFQDSGLRSAALFALTPAGQLNAAVGSGGRVTTDPGGNGGGESRAVTVTPDGGIFAGGQTVEFTPPTAGFVLRYKGFGAAPATPGPDPGPGPGPGPGPNPNPNPGPQQPITVPKPGPPRPTPAVSFSRAALSTSVLRPKTKATLRFTLTGAASVSLTLQQQLVGRQVSSAKGCKKPASGKKRGKPCTYFGSSIGRKLVQAKAGETSLSFTRKFAGKTLKAGIYRLILRATGGASEQIAFTVRAR